MRSSVTQESSLPTKPDFLFVQGDYWDSPWQNRHAMAWETSKRHKALFLSPARYLPDLIDPRRPARTRQSSGITLLKENLWTYVPPSYLFTNFRFPRLDRLLADWRRRLVLRAMEQVGLSRPVLYVWHPAFADSVGLYDESFVVYHKYDNYAGYRGAKGHATQGSNREAELIERADLMLVSSQGLYEMHHAQRPDVQVVPNGVDYELFAATLTDAVSIPDELACIRPPRIGYVGVINEKVDFDLLSALCECHPEWSIVLVGPVKPMAPSFTAKYERLRVHANCHFLGQKAGRDVPAYIKGMSVCMMCYVVNDWTFFGYPLKMHEYLACGKPTVAADLPAIREFSDVIPIASTVDEWRALIEAMLASPEDPSVVSRRLQVAKANSWERRVQEVVSLIERHQGRDVPPASRPAERSTT